MYSLWRRWRPWNSEHWFLGQKNSNFLKNEAQICKQKVNIYNRSVALKLHGGMVTGKKCIKRFLKRVRRIDLRPYCPDADIWARKLCVIGQCVPCGMLSSIPGLCSLDGSSTNSVMPTDSVSRPCQVSTVGCRVLAEKHQRVQGCEETRHMVWPGTLYCLWVCPASRAELCLNL